MHYFPLVFLLLVVACHSGKEPMNGTAEPTSSRNTTDKQTELGLLDTTAGAFPVMPITGIAYNVKGGAIVEFQQQHYWIENLGSWDDRFLEKPVKVWGDIVVRYDAPVFLDTSEIVSQGIPVESEEEMRAQSKRYWIINAKYEIVRP